MTLWPLFLNNKGRRVTKWKYYFPAYERHLGRFVNTAVTMIEIGVADGGSLRMWKEYFGPLARIVGVDIRAQCRECEEDQINVRIGNQSDAGFIRGLVQEFGAPDVVLDDGSHRAEDQLASFECLYRLMSKSGVYIVEDLHTAYWPQFGGGLRKKGTFIEHSKSLVDDLNADHSKGALPPNEFTRSTLSIAFYDSMVVFERGGHGTNRSLAMP